MLTKRLVAGLLIAFTATAAAAQETARVAVAPDSKLWIDGTSNLHDWSCKADKIEANVDLDKAAAAQLDAAPPKALKRVEVKVAVKALKCGHGAMDNNLYKALNADATPDVTYILATFDAAPGATSDTFTLKTVGSLNIAGKENQLSMDVVATRMPDGTVIAKGSVPIKMTDYGIKPPTALFGRLKTGDDVKVNFELSIGAKAIASALDQK
ncbi:MAG TPA: YceI family protein [Gemmatimonadaceae bacterium]|nr:YceI family protein [Gemmatimonadaceae bacterium]